MPLKPHQKQFIICIIASFAIAACFGQEKAHSIKPTTDFDQRFYYTAGETQNVWGYRIGVLINDRYKLGIGGYYMNKTIEVGLPANTLTRTSTDAYILHKKLYLGTVYYEPFLLRRNLWETSLVLETGYGRTANESFDKTTNTGSATNNAMIIPLGAGLSVNLKLPALFRVPLFRWIGINAMAGYRATIYQQDKQYNYNGAYWSISGAIFLDRVFDDFQRWKNQKTIARNKRTVQLSF